LGAARDVLERFRFEQQIAKLDEANLLYLVVRRFAEITRIHGEFAEGPRSKIFANEDFGYRKVTVERPLRLSFRASPERIARLEDDRTFQALATSRKKGESGEREIKGMLEEVLA
jgi:hypothetical protein